MSSVLQPFLLSLIAGLATGGLLVLLLKSVSDRIVSFSMGFASGVMLIVAFNNLFLEAEKFITHIELTVLFSRGSFSLSPSALTKWLHALPKLGGKLWNI